MKVNIIGEIGINHNGDIDLCKKIIDAAVLSGCDYVKFQKRNPDICVPEHQKNLLKNTPWGEMTYLDYKKKIEFNKKEYDEIDKYCKEKKIKWFASVWDKDSADFMSNYCTVSKIPSALITNHELIEYTRNKFEFLIISTGMSTEDEIEKSISVCSPDVIMHTNSTYPSPIDELSLEYITFLKNKYKTEVGYSGHEYGLVTTFAAIPLGVTWIERHITLDRTIWGSDQLASVEPLGFIKLVKGIRDIEKALGGNKPRELYQSEKEKLKSSNVILCSSNYKDYEFLKKNNFKTKFKKLDSTIRDKYQKVKKIHSKKIIIADTFKDDDSLRPYLYHEVNQYIYFLKSLHKIIPKEYEIIVRHRDNSILKKDFLKKILPGIKFSKNKILADDFNDDPILISYSSTTLLEAKEAGLRAISFDCFNKGLNFLNFDRLNKDLKLNKRFNVTIRGEAELHNFFTKYN